MGIIAFIPWLMIEYKKNKYANWLRCIVYLAVLSSCSIHNTQKYYEYSEILNHSQSRWSVKKATEWSLQNSWRVGANFISSTSVNQIEFWQAETFDTITIDRELSWAEELGFNTMRVFLHHSVWEQNAEGFKQRINTYLDIADSHGMATMFVFFDDCWNEYYQIGLQPAPKPGIHNSQWVQDPGSIWDGSEEEEFLLENYVKDILSHFAEDKRILLWDLYNEPGNSGHGESSLYLLRKVFEWAKTIDPSQPITSGIWNPKWVKINKFQLSHSDIISYHNYENIREHSKVIQHLKKYNKPMICTEYLARTLNSTFIAILPLLKENNIGAIHWGLVSGKTQTYLAWQNDTPEGQQPTVWFHDIFYPDGTPYDVREIDWIKSQTSKK